MSWPKLPAKAAYLALKNPQRRNALSLSILRDLKDQLKTYNTSPADGKLRVLPAFQPSLLGDLEATASDTSSSNGHFDSLGWLVNSDEWKKHRRIFSDHFRPKDIPTYHPRMTQSVRKFLCNLLDSPDDFLSHVHRYVSLCATSLQP